MLYKAEDVDTDKALKYLEECISRTYIAEDKARAKTEEYYNGYRDGVYAVRDIFYCSNYEKQKKGE